MNPSPARSTERARLLSRALTRGQAMVEYTVVSHFLLIGSTVLLLPMVVKLIDALNTFYKGLYMVICNGGV